jgi:hypothetical protein
MNQFVVAVLLALRHAASLRFFVEKRQHGFYGGLVIRE